MSLRVLLSLFALAVSTVISTPGRTQCKDQTGANVDWFLIYKLPKMQRVPGNQLTPKGGEFVYLDANTPRTTQTWQLSSQDVYSSSNPLAYTLAPLYQTTTPQDILYLAYNDQSPDEYNGTRSGHTKGVVLFDDLVGIWLLHSVPRFVENIRGGRYSFPESARENAQMMMCITFPTSQLNSIAKQLRMEYANVYDKMGPAEMLQKYPQMGLLFRGSFIRGRSQSLSVVNITSAGGRRVLSVAKRAILEVDLYSSILTGQVRNDLVVQSWRNGAGEKLAANCTSNWTVTNVDVIKLPLGQNAFLSFNTSQDHSKWAVAVDKPVFCIASLNRMESQLRRGGEAMCMQDTLINKLLKKSAIVLTGCPVR